MDGKPSKIIYLLLAGIAALLVINIHSSRRISRLEAEIFHIRSNQMNSFHDIGHISSRLWGIESRIDGVNEQIVQAAKLSFDETVQIQAFHAPTASAEVEVSFLLREHNPTDIISVTARGQDGQLHSAEASISSGGRFTADMTLPLQDNYVFTFTASSDTITTGELMQFNLANQLSGRFSYSLSHGTSTSTWGAGGSQRTTTVNLHPHFRNSTQGNPLLEVTTLALIVERENGDIITSWDLTEYLLSLRDGQTLDMHWDNQLNLNVGDGVRDIRPDENAHVRLVMHDGLGIRYEQMDHIFFPHQLDLRAGSGGSKSVQAVQEWRFGDPTIPWGQLRIVD